MMAFIEQEAKEKVEEIDAKVSEEETSSVSFALIFYEVQFIRISAWCSQIGVVTSLDSHAGD